MDSDKQYDTEQRQAPLKTFQEVGRKDYSWSKQRNRMKKILNKERIAELTPRVLEVNAWAEQREK